MHKHKHNKRDTHDMCAKEQVTAKHALVRLAGAGRIVGQRMHPHRRNPLNVQSTRNCWRAPLVPLLPSDALPRAARERNYKHEADPWLLRALFGKPPLACRKRMHPSGLGASASFTCEPGFDLPISERMRSRC